MFSRWRQKREQTDNIVFGYIASYNQPCSVLKLDKRIGANRLYKSLVRLRHKGLIDSVPGDAIAGGACEQLYFVKEV